MENSQLENDDDLLGQVVEEFFQAVDRGEKPTVREYAKAHPEIAELIEVAIPAMLAAHAPSGGTTDQGLPHDNGKQIGDFRILRQLGRGGMGVVYEADQISMNRRVALKVLPLAGLVDEMKIRRFRNEVRAVAALDHPNVVSVYMVGEERGVHYYAMQLVRGRDLSKVIHSLREVSRVEGPPTERMLVAATEAAGAQDAADVSIQQINVDTVACADSTIPHTSQGDYFRNVAALGIQAANALQHAHMQGVIHRDIKPANLMIDKESNLYVTDFGLARMEADAGVTMTGDLLGTLRYMAPEQALAQNVKIDHRTDIYSLAVTLYELLALRPAYDTTDRSKLLELIAFADPKRLRKIDAAIPIELETIIQKGMAKNRSERYATAAEFSDDLERFINHRPILAKPPTWSQRSAKWVRRNPSLTIAIVVVLTTIAATLGFSRMLMAKQRDNAVQAADALRESLYASDMNNAYTAWSQGNLLRVAKLLAGWIPDEAESDLRGVEWLDLASRVKSHQGKPIGEFVEKSLACDPNRKFLAGVSECDLVVVDLESMEKTTIVEALAQQTDDLGRTGVSVDGKRLAITSPLGTRLIDIQSKESRFLTGSSSSPVAFSPDGSWGVHVGESSSQAIGQIHVWDAKSGETKWSYDELPNQIQAITFSPDSKLVVVVYDRLLHVLDFRSGESRQVPMEQEFVRVARFIDRRTLLISGSGARGLVAVSIDKDNPGWRATDVSHRIPLTNHVACFDISDDASRIALGTEGNVVEVWDLRSAELIWRQTRTTRVNHVFFVDDANGVVISTDGVVERVDVDNQSRSQLESFSRYGWTDCVGFHQERVAVAGLGQSLVLWTPGMGTTKTLRFGNDEDFQTRSISFSGDGTSLAVTGKYDSLVRIWDGTSLEMTKTLDCGQNGGALALSSDGRQLAVATSRVTLWDTATGNVQWEGPRRTTTASLCFSPDGKRLVSGGGNWQVDGLLSIWSIENDDVTLVKDFPHREMVMCLDISPDSRWLVAGDYTGQIVVYDLASTAVHQVINAHPMAVQSFAWSPDGKALVSGAYDGTYNYWQVGTWKQLGAVKMSQAVQGLAFVASQARGLGLFVGTRQSNFSPATQNVFWINSRADDWKWLQASKAVDVPWRISQPSD